MTLAVPAFPETHDAVGNRAQKTSTIPGFPGGLTNYNSNDQLSTDTYDNDGNTTASNGVGYVYDFENHVIQAGAGITMSCGYYSIYRLTSETIASDPNNVRAMPSAWGVGIDTSPQNGCCRATLVAV